MNNELKEKYKLCILNGKRYYEYDMTIPMTHLDETVPYLFKYEDIEICASSWGKMTIEILKAIDDIHPKSEEELLGIHYDWTSTDIFSRDKRTNYTQYKNLYLNTNHTATHSMMNIQGLLKAYGIELSSCYFLLRKHFVAEPLEIKTAVRDETIYYFSKMLNLRGYSDASVEKLLNNFNVINKYLIKVSPGFDDFFLFDEYSSFFNYETRVMEYLRGKTYSNADETYRIIKRCLKKLEDFYKDRAFYEYIIDNPIRADLIDVLHNELEYLFSALNTKVVTAKKIFVRMNLMHHDEMASLGMINNASGMFLLIKTFFGRKYYLSEPFISNDPNIKLSNEEIILSYIYSLDEVTIAMINKYADSMHLKRLSNYLKLFDVLSKDYIQTDCAKMIKVASLNLSQDTIELIKKEIQYYIESFGPIDSRTYLGYKMLPSVGLDWNKYLLLGFCRTYFKDFYNINYYGNQYDLIEYSIVLK